MGQRRREKEWERPRHTRHVWIDHETKLVPPVQGFVLYWRRQKYKWSALVLYVQEVKDAPPRVVQEWLPAERLRPIKSDPNPGFTFY